MVKEEAMRPVRLAFVLLMAVLAFRSPTAVAQEYPARAITIIVPFTAGGAGDILARILSQKLEDKWGKPIVVEDKPGAGSVIGAQAAARATPDGYTLLIAPSSTLAVNVTLFKSLPYDPIADFVPLAMVAQTAFVLVVNPDLPVHSVAELIAYAKAHPGLSYATAGPGVPHHLFAELFKSMTGIDMTPVAYRGSLPALNDVVAGHVPLMFVDLGPGQGIIKAGKVRPIGVSTRARLAGLPDVPSIAESGLPDFDAASWQILVAPAKTPRPIVDKLHDEIEAVLAMPEIKEKIVTDGMVPVPGQSVESLQAFVKAEIARWGKVVHQAGLAGSQ
jgi:tripartite-type tricarboxylate transporter receptor subunit TctC